MLGFKQVMDIPALEKKVKELRLEAIKMLHGAQSGHPGSALSTMDVLVALYYGGVLQQDAKDADNPKRDYFLLSNGHACPGLYAVLADLGYFPKKELKNLRQLGAGVQGHPHRGSLPGIEISSGSLGQGLSVGIGIAHGLKLRHQDNAVYVMMSDGEQEEGSTWEAAMYAPKQQLDNLIAIIDKNGLQIDGATSEIMPNLDPLAEKYEAFGWQVQEIDGHSLEQIFSALTKAKQASQPAVIISQTIRGKGVSYMEGSEHWHAGAVSNEELTQAIAELS